MAAALFKMTTCDVSHAFQTALQHLEKGLSFALLWGNSVAIKARENARAKGGRRWWGDLARSTQVKSVDQLNAEFSTNQVGATIKQYGGVITPVNAKRLTIPIDPIAKGKRAAELDTPERPLFRPEGTSILAWSVMKGRGKNRKATLRPLFRLALRAVQKPDPWFPNEKTVLEAGVEEARRLFGTEVEKCILNQSQQS